MLELQLKLDTKSNFLLANILIPKELSALWFVTLRF